MEKRFSIRKIHRYLSIFIAIQLLLWTVSGIYFAFNKIEMVRGEQYRLPLETEYRIFKRLGGSHFGDVLVNLINHGLSIYRRKNRDFILN